MGLRRVAIVGAGMTKFMRRALETGRELSWQASRLALESCELTLKDVDGVVIGTAPDVFEAMALVLDFPQDDLNYLVTAKVPAGSPAIYYAGFGWTKSGDFAGSADWERYVRQFAERLRAPLEISVSAH